LSGGGTSARLRQTALGQKQQQKIKDEDLTQNPPQGSIAQQIFPLIPERFLSETPEPPLSSEPDAPAAFCGKKVVLGKFLNIEELLGKPTRD
jgi:hypothetical protein